MKPDYTLAVSAARAAAGAQLYPSGALYVVATPIGNLADLSLRGLYVLSMVDIIACEDTRHTQPMLHIVGIDKPLLAIHEHNESEAAVDVIAKLRSGARIAYVCDAGTPAVSDPGARLVAAVRLAGCRVMPIPGASSMTALMSAAGMAGDHGGLVFEGFLSPKAKERQAQVARISQESRAVIVLEAPHRIEALAEALATLGQRPLTVGREMTKQFEEFATMPAQDFAAWLAQEPHRRSGEFAIALHPQALPSPSAGQSERILKLLLAQMPTKTAVMLAAEITSEPRNALYELALRLKGEAGQAGAASATGATGEG